MPEKGVINKLEKLARFEAAVSLIPDHPATIKKVIARVLEGLERLGCFSECTPIRTVLQPIRMKTFIREAKPLPVA